MFRMGRMTLFPGSYKSWFRHKQQSSNTVAPRTDDEPTPAGQGMLAVTLASARSNVGDDGVPSHTGV
jgi:hypothetical protein